MENTLKDYSITIEYTSPDFKNKYDYTVNNEEEILYIRAETINNIIAYDLEEAKDMARNVIKRHNTHEQYSIYDIFESTEK